MLEGRGHLIQSQSQPKSHASLCVQAMAEDLGDQDKAKQIQDQLNELEERAEALDRQRTKNISAIRCASGPVLIGLLSLVHSYQASCGLVRAMLQWLHISGVRHRGSRPPFTVH